MTEATFTVEGLGRPMPAGRRLSWTARLAIVLSIVFVASAAFGVFLWVRAEARASEAVHAVVAEARAWRESRKAELLAASKKKKGRKSKAVAASVAASIPDENAGLDKLEKENRELHAKLDGYFPKGLYIVIDTANNRFLMKDGKKVVVDTICSTGSYSKLDAPDGRSWFFHTPRGMFKVRGKVHNPIWIKPDWAFVEEGEPIPGARHPDRYEPYVMGEYALPFGNGYFIHGTLYNRLLGQSVTHGCVRLADEPLEQVYTAATIGTPIFIY